MTWKLKDTNRGTEKEFETKSEAEEKKQDMIGLGASPDDLELAKANDMDAEIIDQSPDTDETNERPTQPPEPKETATDGYDLPKNPPMDTDPLSWIPSDFVDNIDGTVAINRKGYEVLGQHFDISCQTEMIVSPVETDGEYCVHKAVAENDGTIYTAFGEAYYENEGNEMIRYSDTRSYKRALARATGVGMLAVEELRKEERQ